MMNLKRFGRASLLVSALCLSIAFSGSGCNKTTLEPGGAYAPVATNADGSITPTQAPDPAFYQVDAAFELAYSAIDSTFTFERNNRAALLRISPEVKKALDQIRPSVGDAVEKYTTARKAYKAHPVPAGLDTLNALLAKVQQLNTTVTAIIPKK